MSLSLVIRIAVAFIEKWQKEKKEKVAVATLVRARKKKSKYVPYRIQIWKNEVEKRMCGAGSGYWYERSEK